MIKATIGKGQESNENRDQNTKHNIYDSLRERRFNTYPHQFFLLRFPEAGFFALAVDLESAGAGGAWRPWETCEDDAAAFGSCDVWG
jgi:hypothetical protein